jgi:hypothetical protein
VAFGKKEADAGPEVDPQELQKMAEKADDKIRTDPALQEAIKNTIDEMDRFKAKAMQLLNGRFDSKAELKRMTLMVKRATKDLEDQIFFLRKGL